MASSPEAKGMDVTCLAQEVGLLNFANPLVSFAAFNLSLVWEVIMTMMLKLRPGIYKGLATNPLVEGRLS